MKKTNTTTYYQIQANVLIDRKAKIEKISKKLKKSKQELYREGLDLMISKYEK